MWLLLLFLAVELVKFYAGEEFLSYASWIGDAGGLKTFTGVLYFHEFINIIFYNYIFDLLLSIESIR